MSDTPPYSEATVARVVHSLPVDPDDDTMVVGYIDGVPQWGLPEVVARRVLESLYAAGLLLPEGAERRTHWGWLNAGATEPFEYQTEDDARWGERNGVPGRAVQRQTITTPWSPVPPEPKESPDA